MTRTNGAHLSVAAGVLAVLFVVVAAGHLLAVFTYNITWDEFGLLGRAEATARTGSIQGGGRPGLGTLVLMPLAETCRNAVDALRTARVAWAFMVFLSAGAFWFLLRKVLPPSRSRSTAIATAVAVWVLTPAFLRHSLEVRTDQPAILFGLLGGLALVASERKIWSAALTGVLFAVGFLFSQKLVYVAGLVGILAAGRHLLVGQWSPRRELARVALTGLAFGGVLALYRLSTSLVAETPDMLPLEGQLRTFDFYRRYVGWIYYRRLLPTLVPHVLALILLVLLGLLWLRRRKNQGRFLLLSGIVLAAGVVVAIFHAGRFPYFYMVLGLFPATIAALVLQPLLAPLSHPWARRVVLGLLWTPLSLLALGQTAVLLRDTQERQRESLAFTERALPPEVMGFDGYSALACRHHPDPFPTLFGQGVVARFHGPDSLKATADFLAEFRDDAVGFILPPIPEHPYPEVVREFWRTRFVPYRGQVWVAGQAVEGEPGWSGPFEALVSAEYRWLPEEKRSGPLEIGGVIVPAGGSIHLEAGWHELALPQGGGGLLALALPEPPRPDPRRFFVRF